MEWYSIVIAVVVLVFSIRFLLDKKEKDVSGKVVLITGAGSGIGLLMARKFSDLGSHIIAWDINKEALANVEKEFKSKQRKINTYYCDVSDKNNIYSAVEQVKKDVGRVDILINNAGVVVGKNFLQTTDAQTEKVMAINALAPMFIAKALLPDMIKNKYGHIVTIASAAGTIGCPKLVDYCASKHAAVGFTEALRFELTYEKLDFIKTTCVMPFYINTGMFDGVKSPIIPILDPQNVVDDIVKSIRKDKANLYTPFLVKSTFLMRFFPSSVFEFTSNFIGISKSMDQFHGRSIANSAK